jgi:hypothetical protein
VPEAGGDRRRPRPAAQQGLDELTCLIHDSQTDKKAFVRGLKATYESWLDGEGDLEGARQRRDSAILRLEASVAELAAYEAALDTPSSDAGPSARALVSRLVELDASRWGDSLDAASRRLIPTAADWWAARPVLDELAAALEAAGEPTLAGTPWAYLAPEVLAVPRPETEVAHRASVALGVLDRLLGAFTQPGGPDPVELTLAAARAVSDLAGAVAPLVSRGRAPALTKSSAAAETLRRDVGEWSRAHQACLWPRRRPRAGVTR